MAVDIYAPTVYKALNGVFCVYKPPGISVYHLIHTLRMNLTRELNRLPCRPPRQRVTICDEHTTVSTTDATIASDAAAAAAAATDIAKYGTENKNSFPTISTGIDLSDHPLVTGPRYIEDDFNIRAVDALSWNSSGVQVLAIGRGLSRLRLINQARYLRVYHVKGQLGLATQDFMPTGRIIEKTTYKHVGRARLDRVTSGIQAGHQKYMFTSAGVDLQSQEAYEMACRGLLRPVAQTDESTVGPLLYGVRCIRFKPPDFTLEIHTVNESCVYLMKLIHDIGLELRSAAVCTGVRRLRYGHFTLVHALLAKHCDARSIAENIDFCRSLVALDKLNERVDTITKASTGAPDGAQNAEMLRRQFTEELDSCDDVMTSDVQPPSMINADIKT